MYVAAQNGYSFINSEGEFDLDAYEQAKKIYEAPHEDIYRRAKRC